MAEGGYLDRAIAQALAQAGGNATVARGIVLERAKLDTRLLQALAAPHMNGIVSYHVDRVLRRAKGQAAAPPRRLPPAPPARPAAPPEAPGGMFTQALRDAILQDSGVLFGQEHGGGGARSGPAPASDRHARALRAIAKAPRRIARRDD